MKQILKDMTILTFTGKTVNPFDLKLHDICIEDIAHALSNLCRFTGHTKEFYSVAQHCVQVSYYSTSNPLAGLLHDAGEAYFNDMSSPVKHSGYMDVYAASERDAQLRVYNKFGLEMTEFADVKNADQMAYLVEKANLMQPFKLNDLVCWNPKEAEAFYLARFKELIDEPTS